MIYFKNDNDVHYPATMRPDGYVDISLTSSKKFFPKGELVPVTWVHQKPLEFAVERDFFKYELLVKHPQYVKYLDMDALTKMENPILSVEEVEQLKFLKKIIDKI